MCSHNIHPKKIYIFHFIQMQHEQTDKVSFAEAKTFNTHDKWKVVRER